MAVTLVQRPLDYADGPYWRTIQLVSRRRTGLDDTHPDAHRVHIELLRQAGSERRLQMARSLSATVVGLARRAISQANPGASETEVALRFVELNYGRGLANKVRAHLARRGG